MLTEKQKDVFKKNSVIVLTTCSGSKQPRSIFVEVNKVESDYLVVTNNEMKISSENLKNNPNVFILAFNPDYSCVLKIAGAAEYLTSGEDFEFVKNLEGNKNYSRKAAVKINIKHVEETK